MRKRVLVVAEEIALRARIARTLRPAGYAVELAAGERRAGELISTGEIEAAILAPKSFGAPGLALARELRDAVERLIVVTAVADRDRFVRSLPEADDVLVEPLNERQLLDRLKSKRSLVAAVVPQAAMLRFEGCTLDIAGRVFLDGNGQEVGLTRAEFELLAAMIDNPGRVLSRDQLRHAIAGRGSEPYDRSVDMLVARLRRKIEPDPKSPRFVVTTPGIGYKFAPRPQPIEAPAPISTGLRSDQGQIHSLPAERRQLTVLSGRIVGLAALSSRLDPEDLRQVIGAVRNACVGVLARFQGLLAEFQGDTLLGYFGYPRAHGDDAERAVRGGLQLVRAINDVKVPFARLQLRLGIATGPAVIGNLDGAATECVAVGQPVHWALHLQSVAEPGAVVIASDTRNLVRDSFACDEIGSIALDGSIAPVRAWRVLGERIPSGQFELRCTGMSSSGDRQEEIEPWSRRRSRAMSWRQSSRGSRGNWVASISNKQGRS